jgi:hypothetical protein
MRERVNLLVQRPAGGLHVCVSRLHGGRLALGVGTRWAACACSLRAATSTVGGRPPCMCTQLRELSLNGTSAAVAVKELGMTLGGEPEEDRR